jgi:hypothetical protein
MSAAQRAGLTTRRSLLSNAATLAGAVALPAGRAGAAEAVAGASSAPLHLAQAGTSTAAASSAITTKSTRLVGSAVNSHIGYMGGEDRYDRGTRRPGEGGNPPKRKSVAQYCPVNLKGVG